jgi:hypothetical protein
MSAEEQADPLQVFEDCGAAEMPIPETCMIAETTEEEFLANAEAVKRYRIGQLRTKLTIRQSVVKMAREGVPQMVKIYLDFITENTAADLPMETGEADGGEFSGI